jgi:hypothetical protein
VCVYNYLFILFLIHGALLKVSKFAAGKVKNVGKVQTLLFSATLPDWVKDVCFYVIISSLR